VPVTGRPARRHLNGSDAPAVEHYESVTVLGAKHTGILGKGGDDVLNELVVVDGVGLLVREVHTIAANEPDAQHYRRHGLETRRAARAVAVEHARRRRENAWLAEIAALTRDQRQMRKFCAGSGRRPGVDDPGAVRPAPFWAEGPRLPRSTGRQP
jgi:hypothetical protein